MTCSVTYECHWILWFPIWKYKPRKLNIDSIKVDSQCLKATVSSHILVFRHFHESVWAYAIILWNFDAIFFFPSTVCPSIFNWKFPELTLLLKGKQTDSWYIFVESTCLHHQCFSSKSKQIYKRKTIRNTRVDRSWSSTFSFIISIVTF